MNANEIWINHLEAFKTGSIGIDSESPKFDNIQQATDFLVNGGISPALFNVCVEQLSVYNQIGLYSLLNFSSKTAENTVKKQFIRCLNRMNIV